MPVKITSRYTPLTYDEITKPLIQATEAQAAMENAYMDATDKASQVMAAANQQSDPIAYNRLKAYAEDLQAHADSLVRNGLQRTSRQGLLNLRRRYGEEIVPIENAIARRRELADEQRKLQATNPYLRFERNMDTTSLDDFLTNAELDYGRSINLDDVSKKAATITKALGQGRTDVRNGRQIDKYTKEVLTREGFTPEEIQAALSNDENADSALRSALNNLYTSTGASSFSADVDAEVRDALDYGAYLGAGEVKSQIMEDREAEHRHDDYIRNFEWKRRLAINGLMEDENGNIVENTNSPIYQDKLRRSTKTYTTKKGETVEIEGMGKKSKDYGVIVKGTDDRYYSLKGKDLIYITDQKAAKSDFEGSSEVIADRVMTSKEAGLYVDKNPGTGDFTIASKGGSSYNKTVDIDDFEDEPVAYDKLDDATRAYISGQVAAKGLTISQVDIWENKNGWGKSIYVVTPKGFGLRGEHTSYNKDELGYYENPLVEKTIVIQKPDSFGINGPKIIETQKIIDSALQ